MCKQTDLASITEAINKAIAQLMEHVSSVQIFAMVNDSVNQRSNTYEKGAGDYYTRYGQVRMWLIEEEEKMRIYARDLKRGSDDER